MRPAVLFLSYYGPEHLAPGLRSGRLAVAVARHGIPVVLVHSGDTDQEYRWREGVSARSFRRRDPSAWRDRRRAERIRIDDDRGTRQSLLGQVLRRAARGVLQPDETVLSGFAFARAAGEEYHKLRGQRTSVLVVASGPPWSTLLVGRRVAAAARVPFVVDLQDLWSSNPVGARASWAARWLGMRWERRTFEAATGFIFVNPEIKRRYHELWPRLATRASAIAPIGFDAEPPERMEIRPAEELRIGHFGMLYRDRSFVGLLDACERTRGEGKRAVLHWYGEMLDDPPSRARLSEHIQQGTLVLHKPLPHADALEEMRRCDLLLTVPSPSYPEELTTKLYDYLQVSRPVLALANPASLLGRLVIDAGVGAVYAPGDTAGLTAFLHSCLESPRIFAINRSVLAPHRLDAAGASVAQLIARLLADTL